MAYAITNLISTYFKISRWFMDHLYCTYSNWQYLPST